MKSFTFKQNRILKLRKQQVVMAEHDVARATSEVSLSKTAVEKHFSHIDELDKQLYRRRPDITHISSMSVNLRRRLEEARMQLAEKEQLLERAIDRLRRASQAVEALTVLETRQRNKHTRKQLGREQAIIDSYSTSKWANEG